MNNIGEICDENLTYLLDMHGVEVVVKDKLRTYLDNDYYYGYNSDIDLLPGTKNYHELEYSNEDEFINIGIILGSNSWDDVSVELIPFLTILYMNYSVLNIQVMFYSDYSKHILQFENIEELESITTNEDFILGGSIVRHFYVNISR